VTAPQPTALRAESPDRTFAELPGVRTFRTRPFRLIVASTLLILGSLVLGLALVRQANDPAGQFGVDFADYRVASERVAAGLSPYAPEMLLGPVDAQGTDRYRYPPVLAQLLAPTAGLPLGVVEAGWLVLQLVCVSIAVWVGGSWGGSRRTVERALWSAVAVVLFMPVFDSLWKGNVSDIVALLVVLAAASAAAGGVAATSAAFIKVVPITLVPAALVGGGSRRRSALRAAALTGAFALAVFAISFVLSPQAWRDYAIVLPNLLAGSAPVATNVAPWAVATQLGLPDPIPSLVRVLTVVVALVCLAASTWSSRVGRDARVMSAVAAMLLLPAALWFHYLAALLPFAALGWGRATTRNRLAIVVSAAAITLGVAWLPLATAGAVAMVLSLLRPLSRPRSDEAQEPAPPTPLGPQPTLAA
jgi:hypothetical protein